MYRIGICLSIAVGLSACSSSGSSDKAGTTGADGNTTTTTTTGGTTDAGSTAATTTGTSTDGTTKATGIDDTTNGTSTDDGTTTDTIIGGTTDGTTSEGTTGGNTDAGTGGTTGGNSTAGVTLIGTVSIDDEDFIYMDAGFYSISQQIDLSLLLAEITPTSDRCEVTNLDGDFLDGTIPAVNAAELTTISAGDVLTVSSPAGSYTELLKVEQSGVIFYETDEDLELPTPAPANLSISIPGDQFPAFLNVPIPSVESLVLSAPTQLNSVSANTTFSWNASSNPNSLIFISYSTTTDTEFVTVDCTVIDDGSFAFPASVQAQVGSGAGFGDIYREAISIVQSDNTVLIVVASTDP